MDRLFNQTKCIIAVFIAVFILSIPLLAQENSSESWNKAQAEMKATFGQVPTEFNHMPDFMRAVAWQWFKASNNPNGAIPRKYAELIGLAVAAQIPCNYCVYIHTKQAKMYGATDEEIKEAVAQGAFTRYMSTIENGNQRDFENFKSSWDKMLNYVEAHNKSKQTK
jgi:AhpD family alkylhydroperoxidase